MTYFLEHDGGRWTAFVIRLEGQGKDGAWILRSDFKTASGECTVWFRSDPSAPEDEVDPVPIRQEVARTSPATAAGDVADDPQMQSSLAMNLLLVRRWRSALAALQDPPRAVQYPCQIDRVHRLTTPGPGYAKQHDLNPRVMITGVACLAVDDGKNPLFATSFGQQDPKINHSDSYDDFVDLSHSKTVVHQSFSLSYPATWFLRLHGDVDDQGTIMQHYSALTGGATCSCSLGVSIYRGAHDLLAKRHEEALKRLSARMDGPMGTMVPQPPDHLRQSPNARVFAHALVNPSIDGVAHAVVVWDQSETRFAQVHAFGCVSKASPRSGATLADLTRALPEIIGSFRFVSDGVGSPGM